MNQETTVCVECKSEYFKASSKMVSLCVNCAHYLYGYPNCIHEFQDGNCKKCGWNGITSEFIQAISKDNN